MDAHFNVYKARFEDLDFHISKIRRSQYIHSMDIFINLDDLVHNLHRPNVEKEFELCGYKVTAQCTSNLLNVLAHYKRWAAKAGIKSRVWGYFTSDMSNFKNCIYLKDYRKYFVENMSKDNPNFMLINRAATNALKIAKDISQYVEDIHIIDTAYLEPSVIPLYLKEQGIADYEWGMIVSRDMYDLQYAYRDRWIFVSPKGDNTRIVTRGDMWEYIATREHVVTDDYNVAMYHHDIFPLALAVAGNKFRSIPRLGRIGWKTIFKYLDEVTEKDSASSTILGNRMLEILKKRKVSDDAIMANFMVSSVERQCKVIGDVAGTFIRSQIHNVTDHDNLATMNEVYFSEFPINLQFLTASTKNKGPFAF